jgi:hypothetical protein
VPASAFTVTATGSGGDKPSLQGEVGHGGGTVSPVVAFSGTGQTDESYQLTVTYDRATVSQSSVGWSVAGCGFVANFQFSAFSADAADRED